MTTFKERNPLYNTWYQMKYRCYNTKHPSFKYYGAKGITVCKEWLESVDQFLIDMGPRPEGFTLDKIDNDLGYSKDNCRWASKTTQSLNRKFVTDAKGYRETKYGTFEVQYCSGPNRYSKSFKTELEAKQYYEDNKTRL